MTTFQVGRQAEAKAAEHLSAQGYTILQQNWRTRYCEIDLVAAKDQVIYFIEVKYRSRNDFGSGVDYITPKKLQQMHMAAEFWVQDHRWTEDYRLGVVEVSGPGFRVTNLLIEL